MTVRNQELAVCESGNTTFFRNKSRFDIFRSAISRLRVLCSRNTVTVVLYDILAWAITVLAEIYFRKVGHQVSGRRMRVRMARYPAIASSTVYCPVADTEMREKRPVFFHHCEQCMACIHSCPKKALNDKTITKRRVCCRNPDVTQKELFRKRRRFLLPERPQ